MLVSHILTISCPVEDALLAAAIDNCGDDEPGILPPTEPSSMAKSSLPTMNEADVSPAEDETTDSVEPVSII